MKTIKLERFNCCWKCGNGTCSKYYDIFYFQNEKYKCYNYDYELDVGFFEWLFKILNLEFDALDYELYVSQYNDGNIDYLVLDYLEYKHNIYILFEKIDHEKSTP